MEAPAPTGRTPAVPAPMIWAFSTGGAWGVFAFGFYLSPSEARMDFYAAAAGLIPVLLLTLALQARVFAVVPPLRKLIGQRHAGPGGIRARLRGGTWDEFLYADDLIEEFIYKLLGPVLLAASALVALSTAEFVALHPLATGSASDGNPRIVYGALAAGFLGVAVLALAGASVPPAEPQSAGKDSE